MRFCSRTTLSSNHIKSLIHCSNLSRSTLNQPNAFDTTCINLRLKPAGDLPEPNWIPNSMHFAVLMGFSWCQQGHPGCVQIGLEDLPTCSIIFNHIQIHLAILEPMYIGMVHTACQGQSPQETQGQTGFQDNAMCICTRERWNDLCSFNRCFDSVYKMLDGLNIRYGICIWMVKERYVPPIFGWRMVDMMIHGDISGL